MRFLVDLHTHTLASDHAYSTLGEYINYAHDTGIQMFATTDHGPDLEDAPYYWHFGNLRVVPRVVNDVAILRGIEANITASGDIDIEDFIRERLDIVLAGFHPNLTPTTKEEHTRLMIKVIESGKVDIITHPGSVNYPIDYEAVLNAALKHNVAIEINSSSSVNTRAGSHDNCVAIARLAKEIGNTISLGSDAHIAYFLGNFEESEKVIEEAEMGYDKIINTSPIKVLEFLESRGHKPIEELKEFFIKF
ncbi:Probable phosphatase YcdX [Anaerobiospirillum thomasii]|uniref:Probable phosphatase YcdX n=1 Tax=Anaerobiospirillum thomasii TaxID=179995 RepID=A0A2X0V8J9_9GAMM|nr:phosphatase [Anaerobiospirillum thomasii]SPT69456.1 Probable phosphatase YcdX [Anaerobiospirillum thomasii]SPT71982.1 Probable phosphatase YcdX [Anaerobiospirillum thomasii]